MESEQQGRASLTPLLQPTSDVVLISPSYFQLRSRALRHSNHLSASWMCRPICLV